MNYQNSEPSGRSTQRCLRFKINPNQLALPALNAAILELTLRVAHDVAATFSDEAPLHYTDENRFR